MTDVETFDDLTPEQVHIEAVEAFHTGGNRYAASFELSDHDGEFFRSYLLEVDLGSNLTYKVRQRIEDTIMSHASLAPDRHIVLEIGGLMHDLTPEGDSVTSLPEGVLRRLYHLNGGQQYVVGDGGVGYIRTDDDWQLIPPLNGLALRDIHGPSSDLVYACGNEGTLYQLRGTAWDQVNLPDQRNFTTLEVTNKKLIHIGGREGLALAFRDDELVELSAPARDFFAIRTFKGRRYWSDVNWGLNIQEGDTVVPFRELRQVSYMHTSPEKLVIAGWKEIFVFDGETWDGFELGYDGDIFISRLDMTLYGG